MGYNISEFLQEESDKFIEVFDKVDYWLGNKDLDEVFDVG